MRYYGQPTTGEENGGFCGRACMHEDQSEGATAAADDDEPHRVMHQTRKASPQQFGLTRSARYGHTMRIDLLSKHANSASAKSKVNLLMNIGQLKMHFTRENFTSIST